MTLFIILLMEHVLLSYNELSLLYACNLVNER
jgi:hypothetical protein